MPARGFTHESTYNESKEWYTPRTVFDALSVEFDLDPCSPGKDIVPWVPAKKHYTVENNGMMAHWEGKIFMNPPYGSDTPEWLDHLSSVGNGIALVFARPDTIWFQKYVPLADAICFIKGRISFVPQNKAKEYIEGTFDPQNYFIINKKGKRVKQSPGAASMLIAYGKYMANVLYKCGLGMTLSVGRNVEMFRTGKGFAGGSPTSP